MQGKVKVIVLQNEETNAEDKYALSLDPVGEGKYAKVFKAVNLKDASKIFAVKVIKIESEEVKKQYLRQLKIIKNLPDCPNLVKTHKQHLQSENNLYIFQQFCEAGTLINYKTGKQGETLREEQIYDLFFQVCNGLITLLEAGIIHEDIKPVNILKKGRIFKLCDFGVSQIGAQCKESTTRKGTISYMPPEKLRSRKFLPNEKSDIYSLGTCIYEIIFSFHPYLKKKTANYKQYLVALDEATLRPISTLMNKIGSSSLRLQNFLKFLQRMIDLNSKTRVNLQQLKQFIRTTQPFISMKIPEQQILELPDKKIHSQDLININLSIVRYITEHEDHLNITSKKQEQPKLVQSNQNIQQVFEQPIDQQKLLLQKINQNYSEENAFVVEILGFLIRGIDYIRKSNFCQLNITGVGKNFLNIDLKDCMASRYIKYLIYQYSISVRKNFKQRYQTCLDDDQLENLQQQKRFLDNEFNKFLIETNFQNKFSFGKEISEVQAEQLSKQISFMLGDYLSSLTMVKQNKKENLLSVVYCVHMPKLLEILSSIKCIFSNVSLQVLSNKAHDSQSMKQGRVLLDYIYELQTSKAPAIRQQVQKLLEGKGIQILFEIQQESEEIQVIEQDDLV